MKRCIHVKHVAEEMWKNDGLMDDTVETLTFSVNTGSSDEDSDGLSELIQNSSAFY